MEQRINKSIKCNVNNCKYNCGCAQGEYCTLNCITVGTHESDPTQVQCTDCQSFEMK